MYFCKCNYLYRLYLFLDLCVIMYLYILLFDYKKLSYSYTIGDRSWKSISILTHYTLCLSAYKWMLVIYIHPPYISKSGLSDSHYDERDYHRIYIYMKLILGCINHGHWISTLTKLDKTTKNFLMPFNIEVGNV